MHGESGPHRERMGNALGNAWGTYKEPVGTHKDHTGNKFSNLIRLQHESAKCEANRKNQLQPLPLYISLSDINTG